MSGEITWNIGSRRGLHHVSKIPTMVWTLSQKPPRRRLSRSLGIHSLQHPPFKSSISTEEAFEKMVCERFQVCIESHLRFTFDELYGEKIPLQELRRRIVRIPLRFMGIWRRRRGGWRSCGLKLRILGFEGALDHWLCLDGSFFIPKWNAVTVQGLQ